MCSSLFAFSFYYNRNFKIWFKFLNSFRQRVKFEIPIRIQIFHLIFNFILRTRSRIIAHNDKLKQNSDAEHRDQGLTRPKVLIIVPFRKCALKLVKIIISLIMRKSEEFVSNKKRFYDSFGPEGDSKDDHDDKEEADEQNKKEKAEDFNLLFSGNVEGNFSLFFSKTYFLRQKFLIDFKIQDHFKIGLSVAKKSIKLYTEFYSSDIIIASPLGLKSVIGIEEYVLVNCFKTIKTIKIKIIKIKTETKKETMIS